MTSRLQTGSDMISARASRGQPWFAERRFLINSTTVLALLALLPVQACRNLGPAKATSDVYRQAPNFNAPNPDVAAVLKIAAKAPPLPAPQEPLLRVKTAEELYRAVHTCAPNTTILLAEGVYPLHQALVVRTDGVQLRGESGDREKVILDGGNRDITLVMLMGADDVLVADLTLRNSGVHGLDIKGDNDTQRTRVYNVKFQNIWERAIKGTHPKRTAGFEGSPDDPECRATRPVGGSIRYCLFVNDARKSRNDWAGGDYIAGIDMMWLKNWVIADNVFIGIRGKNGIGRGAIFIWVNSENVTAERNIIVNCDRGICFGNPSGGRPHMTRGVIQNNFIVGGVNSAIEAIRTVDTRISHNTIYAAWPELPDSVLVIQGSEGIELVNNFIHGRIHLEYGVKAEHNLIGDYGDCFVNPAIGNLHLTEKAAEALGRAKPLKEATEDFDRKKRKDQPDIGAQETDLTPPESFQARTMPPYPRIPPPTAEFLNKSNPDVQAVVKAAAKAPALPAPAGNVVKVATAGELYAAAKSLQDGTTILLADGVYNLKDPLLLHGKNIAVRGASGNREKVILDGQMGWGGILRVRGAEKLLIADLTVTDSHFGIYMLGDSDVNGIQIYNVKFYNIWRRGLKGTHPARMDDSPDNLLPPDQVRKIRPRNGEVRYCLFVNDHPKTDDTDGFKGDYISGMDLMGLMNWVVADNVFIGIRGKNGLGRGAIFIWVHSEDVTAERNVIINCDRGICFGNPSGDRPHMTRGVIQNNFIVGGATEAIEIIRTLDTRVCHNTIWATRPEYPDEVQFLQGSEGGEFVNNLVHGQVSIEYGVLNEGNQVGDLTGWFVNPEVCDLHLTEKGKKALKAGAPLDLNPAVKTTTKGAKGSDHQDIAEPL
jgi:hypothetical protein